MNANTNRTESENGSTAEDTSGDERAISDGGVAQMPAAESGQSSSLTTNTLILDEDGFADAQTAAISILTTLKETDAENSDRDFGDERLTRIIEGLESDRDKIEQLTLELSRESEKKDALASGLEEERARKEELQAELEQQRSRADTLEEQLEESSAKIAALEENLDTQEDRINNLERELDEERAHAKGMRTELHQARVRVSELEEYLSERHDRVSQLNKVIGNQSDRIKEAETNAREHRERANQLDKVIGIQSGRIEEAETKAREHRERAEALEAELLQARTRLSELEDYLSERHGRAEELEDVVEVQSARIKELEGKVSTQRDRAEDLESKLRDARSRVSELKDRDLPDGALYGGQESEETEPVSEKNAERGATTAELTEAAENEECPECSGRLDNSQPGESVCRECGLVVNDSKVDYGPEWRAFDEQEHEEKSRVGGPTTNTMHDKGLSTTISWENKDAYGNSLSAKKRQKIQRLRKWDERCRAKDSGERNLMQALGEVQRLTSELDIPEHVEETASVIYRRALDDDLVQGRSIESVATAAMYAAIRQAGLPRTLDQVAQYARVPEKRVSRAFSYLQQELNMEVKPPNVLEYLPKAASHMGVSDEIEAKAEELLEVAIENNAHSGKAPAGQAAAAVYAAALLTDNQDQVTQEKAKEVGDVCPLTIRNRYRELLEVYGVDYEDYQPESQPPAQKTADESDSEIEADSNTTATAD